jgi:hypothetical protein
MDEYATVSLDVSDLTPICSRIRYVILAVAQSLLDEVVTLGEPLDEIFIVNIIDGDVQMLVAFDKRRVLGELPVCDRDNVRDVAVGQRLWPPERDEAISGILSDASKRACWNAGLGVKDDKSEEE